MPKYVISDFHNSNFCDSELCEFIVGDSGGARQEQQGRDGDGCRVPSWFFRREARRKSLAGGYTVRGHIPDASATRAVG